MTDQERNELLIRLDERTRNIYHELYEKDDSLKNKIEEVLKHQKEQNGEILQCIKDISNHSSSINLMKWIIGIGLPAIITIFGYFIYYISKV